MEEKERRKKNQQSIDLAYKHGYTLIHLEQKLSRPAKQNNSKNEMLNLYYIITTYVKLIQQQSAGGCLSEAKKTPTG